MPSASEAFLSTGRVNWKGESSNPKARGKEEADALALSLEGGKLGSLSVPGQLWCRSSRHRRHDARDRDSKLPCGVKGDRVETWLKSKG